MRIIKRMAFTLAVLASYLGLVHIANSEPLTPQQVERFIESMPQLAPRHGFSSAEQWAEVGDRTMQADLIAKNSIPSEQVEAGYQQGIANVKNDPGLPASRKEAILAGMEKGHKRNMDARRSSEKDMPAVQPHLATLDKLLE